MVVWREVKGLNLAIFWRWNQKIMFGINGGGDQVPRDNFRALGQENARHSLGSD